MGHAEKSLIAARATVTIAPGKTATVKLSLNAKGRRLLARHHKLVVKLAIAQLIAGEHSQFATRRLTFHATNRRGK